MEAVGRMDCPQWGGMDRGHQRGSGIDGPLRKPKAFGGPARVEHDRLVVQVGEWDP